MEINETRTVNELVTAVSMAMDIVDGTKLYHGWRVAIIAARLAGLQGGCSVRDSFYGGLLHDVGAVGLPQHLVTYLSNRAGSDASGIAPDRTIISHPLLSAEIVGSLPGICGAARAVMDHHESWNGHGFPRGLQGLEIALEGQILNAADMVDFMMRGERPPRLHTILAAVSRSAGKRLSPEVAECLAEVLVGGGFDDLADPDELPSLFERTRCEVGDIPVGNGVDAVGVTLEVLARVADNKHSYTVGHSRRVSRYSLLIGIALGLEHDDLTLLRWAALVHDVGKLSVPTAVLDKPGALTPEERGLIEFHASYTLDIVSRITDLRPVAFVAGSHHERYDGKGYPLGWAGEAIPPGARVMAVADAFDTMTSMRPYRPAESVDEACSEIERMAGSQFDPQLVPAAIPLLRNVGCVVATSA